MDIKLIKMPKTVDLAITNQCNLRCRHCGHFTSAGDTNQDLSKDEWLQFFKELNRHSIMDVSISGGEPFFRKDLKDLILGIVQNRMRFSILSNGILLNDEMASFLASTGRLSRVQISIDGSIPTTHEALRGEGTFNKAVEGIKLLQKYKIPTDVRVTIHKQNVRELPEIAHLLLEEFALPGFSTNSASHMGLCRKNAEIVQLTTEERILAMEALLKLNTKYNNRISAAAGPLADAKTWNEMEKSRSEGKERPADKGCLTACGSVMSRLAVRADGVIVPCPNLSQIELGRINRDDLIDVWQNHPELKRVRERRNIPLSNFEFCRGCDHINYCTGNCPAIAYTLLGEVNHPSPDACLRKFLSEGGKLPALTTYE